MTGIEWTERSDWNPLRGCTRVSEGCRNCYAETIAARFSDPGQPFHGFAKRKASGPRWTGKVELIESRLTLPLKWRKPARIFANSASDFFHDAVPDAVLDRLFAVMIAAQLPPPPHYRERAQKNYLEAFAYGFAALAAVRETLNAELQ